MSHQPQDDEPGTTPEQLREQIEHTRDQLGRTVEALAGKADIKAQTKAKAAEAKEQAVEQAALLTGRIQGKASQAAGLIKARTPDPVLDHVTHAAAQVRDGAAHVGHLVAENTPRPARRKAASAGTLARAGRTPLLAVAALTAVLLVLRRNRRRT
ncbi:DUF3618 domain-containing protein [Streptomyces sp. NPDC004779]